MFELVKKGFEKVTGTDKKKEESQRINSEVSSAIRNCLAMRNGENSLMKLEFKKRELSKVPHPYTEEANRLWELKKIEFDANIDQDANFISREISFVRGSGVVVASGAIKEMEALRKEFLAMKFSSEVGRSELKSDAMFDTGRKF